MRATQENTGAIRQSNAEKPRRGGKNPPVREEPASHLASRRHAGSLPNASNRAEAHTHFMRTEENMRKNKQFSIRISAQDLETIRQKAVQAHMSQSDYVISCCLGKKIIILDGLKEVLRQQKAIGNNLNQLAVLANMGKVQFANLDAATQAFAKINTALREIQEEVRQDRNRPFRELQKGDADAQMPEKRDAVCVTGK